MSMAELFRLFQALEEVGLDDTQIKNIIKYIESGDQQYIDAAKAKGNAS